MIGSELVRGRGESPRVMVYTGPGSSPSWIWLASAMERMNLMNVRFVDAHGLLRGETPDALVISGGDPFRIAQEIGAEGYERTRRWISRGGTYIGICAGAYLGLRSEASPLPSLGLVRSRIANLAGAPPIHIGWPERSLVPCGERFVFHAVRGTVRLDVMKRPMSAPLFGGPCWIGAGDAQALAHYRHWEEGATVLTDPGLARRTLAGRAAVLLKPIGKGKAFLVGPHFEHPDFPSDHGVVGSMLLESRRSKVRSFERMGSPVPVIGIRRALSEARVSYSGLEGASWTIGHKTWEQEKIGHYLNAMWERLLAADQEGIPIQVPQGLEDELRSCVRTIRAIRRDIKQGMDTTIEATMLFDSLSSAASSFLNAYFEGRSNLLTG
jgi:glutamine amidotransferase-like uncharacterized protein